jgi:GT2 family glycosyltransferase
VADFTVVICTYNGEQRLPAVLERLRLQQNTQSFSWDILVVDNNSSDRTSQVVRQYQASWSGPAPLYYCFEPRQGLAFARRCAVQETRSPLIGFLDDDNLPEANWVYAAYQFGQEHPEAGAYGSRIHGLYEIEPPQNFKRIACYLAIVDRGNTPHPYPVKRGVLPPGAGMVIRRQLWLRYVPPVPKLSGVCSTSLTGKGEDVETLSYLRNAGYTIWYNPAMQIDHHIPATRLSQCYLINIMRSVGFNRYPLRMLHHASWQRPLFLVLYMVNDLRRLSLHLLRHGRSIPRDLVLTCETWVLLCTLLSPLHYYWSRFNVPVHQSMGRGVMISQ